MGVELWTEKEVQLGAGFDAFKLKRVSVLSKRGVKLGSVKEARVKNESLAFEGIIVNRGLFQKDVYFGKSYIQKISPQGIVLLIEPPYLFIGKKVLTSEGKVLGRVKEISRADNSAELTSIVVKKLFHKPIKISADQIKLASKALVLKESYRGEDKHG